MFKLIKLIRNIMNKKNCDEEINIAILVSTRERHLPTLFKTTAQERFWECSVLNNTIYTFWGVVGGVIQKNERDISGSNKGASNELTPEERAWATANKYWIEQLEKGYEPDPLDINGISLKNKVLNEKRKSGGTNINSVAAIGGRKTKNTKLNISTTNIVEGAPIIIPMKAEKWELKDSSDPHSVLPKVSKYFEGSFYMQPKLDGWRCRIFVFNKKVIMTTNSGKQYPWFTSLRLLIEKWFKKINHKDLLDGLDGELYSEKFTASDGSYIDPLATFATIQSICTPTRSEPHELEDQLQFHCFDLIDATKTITQKERFDRLDSLFSKLPIECKERIIRVDTKIGTKKDFVIFHNECVADGKEGVMARSMNLLYKPGGGNQRSLELRKFKYFDDNEFKIVGCKCDEGVSDEHFVWVCETEDGKEFKAKQKGNKDQRSEWFNNKDQYIGKYITVKFQGYSDKGIPRFPIAKCFRKGKSKDS